MKKVIKKYQIEIFLFVFFVVELFLNIPEMEKLDSWCTTYYTISYRFGFSSRLLIGSIMEMLFPVLYASVLYVVLISIGVILSAVAASVFGYFIKKAEPSLKGIVMFLVALWVASPADISYLFLQNTFGRMDTFLLLYTLLILSVCLKWKTSKKWYLVTVLALLGVLTHQVYIFIYFPIPAGILLYETFKSRDKAYIKYVILFFGSCFCLALYLQLFSKVNCVSAQQMYQKVITRTSVQNVSEIVLQFEYFAEFSDHWTYFGQYMIADCIRMGLAAIVLLTPLWLFLGKIWRGYIRATEKKDRIGIALMLLCHVAYIPIFIITVDWGRWLAALFIFEFALILYLACVGDKAMTVSLKGRWDKIVKNPMPYALMLIYLPILGKFDAINVCSSAERVVQYMQKWIEYLH